MASEQEFSAVAKLHDLITGKLKQIEKNSTDSFKRMEEGIEKLNKTSKNNNDTSEKSIGIFTRMRSSLMSFAERFAPTALLIGGLTLAINKLSSAITYIVDTNIAFEKTMSSVKAIINPTTTEFKKLSTEAKRLGESTVFSASQAGEAFTELGKLGLTTNQILTSTSDILNLASASGVELATAGEIVVKTMHAFNLEAEDSKNITDIMARSFNASALDITKFQESMKYVGTSARLVGVDLKDTTAMLGVLADNSIDASMAGTSLNQAFIQLANPASKVNKIFERFGVQNESILNKMKFLREANIDVGTAFEVLDVRAGRALNIILNSDVAFKKLRSTLDDTSISAESMSRIMLDNVAGALTMLESEQEGLALAIGETFGSDKRKRIEMYIKFVSSATNFVREHAGEFRKMASMLNTVLVTAFNAFKGVLKIIADNFEDIISTVKVLFTVLSVVALAKLSSMFFGLAFSVTRFNASLLLLKLNPTVLALTAIVSGMELITKQAEKTTENLNKLVGAFDDINKAKAMLDLRKSFDATNQRIDILKSKARDVSSSAEAIQNMKGLTEAKNDLKEINKQAKEIAGFSFDTAEGQRLTSSILTKSVDVLTNKIEKEQKLLDIENEKNKISGDEFKGDETRLNFSQEEADKLKAIEEKMQSELTNIREASLKRSILGEKTLLIEKYSALNIMFKGHKEDLKLINDEFLFQLQAINIKEKEGAFKLAEELRLSAMEEKARELEELRLQFEERLIIVAGDKELQLSLEQDFQRQRSDINKKFHEEDIKRTEERTKKEQEAVQARIEAWGNLATSITGFVGDIASVMGASAKAQKKIALVEAIIHGALAVQKALASSAPPLSWINATATGIASAGNIATIASQAFAKGGFPSGKNAMVRVNESGQEAILNPSATQRLGVGNINALNSSQPINRSVTNEISYSPNISISSGGNNVSESIVQMLKKDKDSFAKFLRHDVIDRGYLV